MAADFLGTLYRETKTEVTGFQGRQLAGLLFTSVVALFSTSALAQQATLNRTSIAMGTSLSLTVFDRPKPTAISATTKMMALINNTERRLSSWIPDSELSRLNKLAPNVDMRLSGPLMHDLLQARQCARQTDYFFDPTLGALIKVWDIHGSGKTPTPSEIGAALQTSGIEKLSLDNGYARKTVPGLILDSGAYGKGVALDAAAAYAMTNTMAALIDFGGQLLWTGKGSLDVEIASPQDRANPIAEVQILAGSIAVSSNHARALAEPSRSNVHILDSHTGRPTDRIAIVAVFSQSAFWADCLSTAFFAMGPKKAYAWLQENSTEALEVMYIWQENNRDYYWVTSGWGKSLHWHKTGIQLWPPEAP